jgi:hypothetical protein
MAARIGNYRAMFYTAVDVDQALDNALTTLAEEGAASS